MELIIEILIYAVFLFIVGLYKYKKGYKKGYEDCKNNKQLEWQRDSMSKLRKCEVVR